MILSNDIKNFIRLHSEEVFPEECCGLVVEKSGGQILPIRCNNEASDKLNFFKISPIDYIRAHREGKIIASYHSHPGEQQDKFSEFDKQASSNLKLNYILFVTRSDSFLEFDPNSHYNSYVGRVFLCGQHDCYSLIKSFYKDEFNLDIPDLIPNRTANDPVITSNKYGELIENNYEENGWKRIFDFDDLKKYDGLCFDYRKSGTIDHVGVYLGNNLLLHHPRDAYSCVENISLKSLKFLKMALRREGLA